MNRRFARSRLLADVQDRLRGRGASVLRERWRGRAVGRVRALPAAMSIGVIAIALMACTGSGTTTRDAAMTRPRSGSSTATPPARPAPLQHIVFIRLRDPLDTAELVDACNALAAAVPTVRTAFTGLHEETGRDSIVHDYDVCLIVGFDDVAGYQTYLDHPAHLSLLEQWRARIEWLRIYDAMDVAP